jgi:hypothetical protein
MKKDIEDKARRVEQALAAAHHGRPEREPGEAFARGVMRDIRRMGSPPGEGLLPAGNETRMAWEFAAATCLLALFILIYASGADFSGVPMELAGAVLGDAPDQVLADAFLLI